MNEPAADDLGGASSTPPTPIPSLAQRFVWRRESAILAALAVAGAAIEYPLALAIKSFQLPELGRVLPFLGVTLILASLIPIALRINQKIGLPGAPLIAAKVGREKLFFSVGSLLRVSLGYAALAAVAGASVLALVIVPLMMLRHGGGGIALPKTPLLTVAPRRIAIVGAAVAIVAAVSEEIQFRLVLYAILGWVAALMSRDSSGRLGRRALWIVTLAQGYAFGLMHLAPLAGTLFHSTPRFLIGGLVMPQTWEGVVFGRLYLRRGLEASIIAHASMDGGLFVLAAIGMMGAHLGKG